MLYIERPVVRIHNSTHLNGLVFYYIHLICKIRFANHISSLTYWKKIHFTSLDVMKKVIKGAWRMPRLSKAMKDVISCDKLRGGANNR